MDFLRARTQQQIEQRQVDIIQACDALFEQGGYDNVNMKAISEMTTITRSSIYTYYKTKDEIILDLLREELLTWKDDLLLWAQKKAPLNKADFCKEFVCLLLNHEKMLKHFYLLYTFLEVNCRLDKLVAFKKDAIPVVSSLVEVLLRNFPVYTQAQASFIAEEIISYVLGVYPTTHLTAKQKKALSLSRAEYHILDFTQLCEDGIYALLR